MFYSKVKKEGAERLCTYGYIKYIYMHMHAIHDFSGDAPPPLPTSSFAISNASSGLSEVSELAKSSLDLLPIPQPSRMRRRHVGTCPWVVVRIMVPFWVLSIVRHLVFRGPKRDRNFDNHPCTYT